MADSERRLGFLIVGTPRSGTTLVQRICSSLPTVDVPLETHFLAYALEHPRVFPVASERLAEVLKQYVSWSPVRHELDGQAIATWLPPRPSYGVMDLFRAVVAALTDPAATTLGEKTPRHLAWIGPLAAHDPSLRFIALVRDPRAVVASLHRKQWAASRTSDLMQRWRAEQLFLTRAHSRLGSRLLRLRYEDIVVQPDATRDEIAHFLDVETGAPPIESGPDRAGGDLDPFGPVSADRVDAWRSALTARQVAHIERVCGRELRRLGYPTSTRGLWRPPAFPELARLYRSRATAQRLLADTGTPAS